VIEKLILYADDDNDDRAWVHDACKVLQSKLNFHFVGNGREVLEYLRQHSNALPSLIVLDLNMPEMDGRQTLQQLKASPDHKEIPVAIVTTSANKIDIEVCQRLGAALYLIKPDTHKEWQNVVRRLEPIVS
jgi:two-component system response regulator